MRSATSSAAGRAENLYLLRDGLGPRRGRLLGISTAGAELESPLGEMRTEAHALPGFRRDGCRNHVRTKHSSFNEWCLADGDDVDDLDLVKEANPLRAMTVEELQMRRESSPDWVRRFACGRVSWARTARSARQSGATARVRARTFPMTPRAWSSASTSAGDDTSAFAPIYRETEDAPVIVGRPQILTPPGGGRSLDSEDVFATAQAFADRWPDVTVVLDPRADGEQLAQRLDRELRPA